MRVESETSSQKAVMQMLAQRICGDARAEAVNRMICFTVEKMAAETRWTATGFPERLNECDMPALKITRC